MEPVIPASPPGGAEGPARPPLDLRAAALSAAFLALLVLPSASPWFAPALVAVAAATGALAPGLRYGAVPLLGGVLAAALALLWGEDSLRTVYNALTAGLACGALPWLLAGAWAGHRRSVAREWEALERAEESRRHGAEAARMRERNAVAEELHDDLGHALSLVALNLGRLELSPDLGEEHREAVVRARREVGEAVERLGASVELLRGDAPSPAERSPAGVADLVANARSAGAGIDAEGEPAAERLAEFVAAGVHRVVQEGLTNALKHAPGQPVLVRFADRGESLAVTVRNPAPGPPGPRPGGSGLIALRERVRALGGTVSAGHDGEAFTLQAVLPRGAGRPASRPRSSRPRRPGWPARCAAGWSGPAAGAPCGSARRWPPRSPRWRWWPPSRRRSTSGTPPAPCSPPPPTPPSPPATPAPRPRPSSPPAGECRYYAVTADPLDDAFGDSYRICFTGDRVSSTDLLENSAP